MKFKRRVLALGGIILFLLSLSLLFTKEKTGAKTVAEVNSPTPKTEKKLTSVSNVKSKRRADPERVEKNSLSISAKPNAIEEQKSNLFIGRVIDEEGAGIPKCVLTISTNKQRFSFPRRFIHQALNGNDRTARGPFTKKLNPYDRTAFTIQTKTDAQGRFKVKKPTSFERSALIIIQSPQGYQDYRHVIEMPKDNDFGDFILRETGGVCGTVYNDRNDVAKNTAVLLMTAENFDSYQNRGKFSIDDYPFAISRADGRFEFPKTVPGDYVLLSKSSKSREVAAKVTVFKGSSAERDLRLPSPSTIELTIVDQRGQSVANAQVGLRSEDKWLLFNEVNNRIYSGRKKIKGLSDSLGQCQLNPNYERRLVLTIDAPGYSEYQRPILINESSPLVRLQVRLQAPVTVSGQILNADRKAIRASVFVCALDAFGKIEEGYIVRVDSDSRGKFSLPPLSPGRYSLWCAKYASMLFLHSPLGQSQLLDIPIGKDKIQLPPILLPRACRLRITTVNSVGAPVRGVTFSAFQLGQRVHSSPGTAVSDSDGIFLFKGLRPGPIQVLAELNGATVAFQSLVIPSSTQSPLTMRIPERGGQLKVTLVDHRGCPVSRGLLSASILGSLECVGSDEKLIHGKGTSTLKKLPPGTLTINYFNDQWPRQAVQLGEVQIQAGQDIEASFQLPAPK